MRAVIGVRLLMAAAWPAVAQEHKLEHSPASDVGPQPSLLKDCHHG